MTTFEWVLVCMAVFFGTSSFIMIIYEIIKDLKGGAGEN